MPLRSLPRRLHPRIARFSLVVGAVALLTLVLGSQPGIAATTSVKVGQTAGGSAGQGFNSASVTIAAGDSVRWEWFNGSHDIQSANAPGLSSGAKAGFNSPGQVYTYTFSTPGTYTYYCDEHAGSSDAELDKVDQSIRDGKMVGKVVVTAAGPSDTQAPTVSGVSASPNPTNGAGTVTLVATINDTAASGATAAVAGAEWSKGAAAASAGSGTVMAPSDGAWGAGSEGATASVAISDGAGTAVTLWVRGRDASGNWGAAASTVVNVTASASAPLQATVNVTSGSLTSRAQPVDFGSVILTGGDRTLASSTDPWLVHDGRGSGAGWNVTVTSTGFTAAGGSIPVANFKVRVLGVSTLYGNTPPTATPATFTSLSSSAPLTLLSAAAGTGMGSYAYTPDFQLTVPGSTGPGAYLATITVSLNSGP